jgi:osmotically-inducible protein OsmY
MKRLARWWLVTLAGLAGLACSNTVDGLKKDAEEKKLEEKAEKAAEAVTSAVQEAGHEIKAKSLALEIKATLMGDERVDASHVHVKADDESRTLTLSGSVPTAAQKEIAGTIARSKAGSYRVKNLLTAGRT